MPVLGEKTVQNKQKKAEKQQKKGALLRHAICEHGRGNVLGGVVICGALCVFVYVCVWGGVF